MISTRRIFLSVKPKRLLNQPFRTLHMSIPRLMPVRGPDGSRLWTDEELRAAERRGFENAGGNWSERSTSQTGNEFTAEDIKAALERGMEKADQYVGAAIRGVWDKGFSEGKIAGADDEKINSERKIQEERLANERKMKAQITEARRISYAEGLAANPDLIKAKQEGLVEGEKIGREQTERATEKKIQNAKEIAINEYIYNKKFSTRLNNWRENVSEKWKQGAAQKNKQPVSSIPKKSLRKMIGEIPITARTVKVHRRKTKHRPLHFSYNDRHMFLYKSYFVFAYVYPPQVSPDSFDIDKIRLKDLPNSMILGDICNGYKYSGTPFHRATPIPLYIAPKFAALSISLLLLVISLQLYQRKQDQYLYGETPDQYDQRKSIEEQCKKLEKITPEDFDTLTFTPTEEKQLQICKQGCLSAKTFHEEMRLEMDARRKSDFGDATFFGKRKLTGIYDDDAKTVPLLEAEHNFTRSIHLRVESERKASKEKKDIEELASKEERYHQIKNTGLRK